ncbi:hypothetical protein [Streptomyces cinereoruber]|uniref:hypothetical protein n=1 Tax=Streptomyces cinereoruber TaxID=67260 RepID=UPI00365AB29D
MTARPDPAVSRLLRPDGSVTVPAAVAGEVLRALLRDLAAQRHTDGGEVSNDARRVLHALHAASVRSAGFAPESPAPATATVEVTAHQAAELLGCSPQYARHLARVGRVRARRAGPLWLLDRASLDAYRTGSTT